MLLNFLELVKKYNVKSKGVISIGAHFGEEYEDYVKAGIEKIVFIEPCKSTFKILQERFQQNGNVCIYNFACGDIERFQMMYTGSQNEGQSNSLLRMKKHLDIHKGISLTKTEMVMVMKVDSFAALETDYNFLTMDCQGYEGFILKGAPETLKHIDYVYTEANMDEVYENNTMIDELDLLLHEFERVETGTWIGGMWTDVFYVRKTLLN